MIGLVALSVLLMTVAPAAFARDDAGEGWYGETTDKTVTNLMFLVIIFFPVLLLALTLIQSQLDKRKYARKAAQKAREANADWRGGW